VVLYLVEIFGEVSMQCFVLFGGAEFLVVGRVIWILWDVLGRGCVGLRVR